MKAELDIVVEAMTSNEDKFVPIYGTNSWQNMIIDEAAFPVVCFDLPDVDYILPKSGAILEEYPLTVFVAYKSELDWTGSQHEDAIEKANTATRELLSLINNSKDVNGNRTLEITKVGRGKRVKCAFDVCCSGILVPLTIKPSIFKSVCT